MRWVCLRGVAISLQRSVVTRPPQCRADYQFMKPAPFIYYAPTSLDEAVALLAELGPQDGRILAGGQSLVPTMAFRMARPAHLIDINGIAELATVTVRDNILAIGACVRHAAFETDAVPGATGALLRKVVENIAHYPIRTRGTFCGSIANADPASEWCCVVAALDGVVLARSQRGIRRVAAADFFQGVMTTVLEEDELIVAIELPLLLEDTATGFAEFSRRKGDFAIAMALVTYRLESGLIIQPRVAIGGAETHPRRLPEAEALLTGKMPEGIAFSAAAQTASLAIDPMEDINNTTGYRRKLVQTLLKRALETAA
jgi:aerobic carbon-monoxide dehydrogenase medium subunit